MFKYININIIRIHTLEIDRCPAIFYNWPWYYVNYDIVKARIKGKNRRQGVARERIPCNDHNFFSLE